MRKIITAWVLAAAVLGVGVVGAMLRDAAPADAAIGPLERVTVPSVAFRQQYAGQASWYHSGFALRGTGDFMAPVAFPHERVRIRRIIVKYYDDNPNKLCVTYYRAQPNEGTADSSGFVCSEGSSPVWPRTMVLTPDQQNVNGWQAGYLMVHFETTSTGLLLYGATVEYFPIM
jgi:hypothetical protein